MAWNSTTSFDDLSQETATNILSRLPVKALIRSTTVNKKWYSLITNPHFISAQIKHAISQSDDNVVLVIPPVISQEKHCSLVSIETSKVLEKYELPFTTRTKSLKLIDSLDGLMLLTDLHAFYASRHLYLWNPCVKTHRPLVSSCFKKLFEDPYISYFISGLGFNQASNDYRVVRVVYDVINKMNPAKAEVYSLSKQTWRKIKDPVVPRIGQGDGVYVDGRFYWLETTPPDTREDGRIHKIKDLWILSFDFENEVFGELKVPKIVSKCIGTTALSKLVQFEGSLALCVFDAQSTDRGVSYPLRIWLLRKENGVVSWILRFTAALREVGWPINITNKGTILIETRPSTSRIDVTSILSCNLKSMHYKNLGFGKPKGVEDPMLIPEPCTVDTSFTESLVMYEGGKSILKFSK
ncbi:hypothetical protein ACET3Z_003848 [Daucus carota]